MCRLACLPLLLCARMKSSHIVIYTVPFHDHIIALLLAVVCVYLLYTPYYSVLYLSAGHTKNRHANIRETILSSWEHPALGAAVAADRLSLALAQHVWRGAAAMHTGRELGCDVYRGRYIALRSCCAGGACHVRCWWCGVMVCLLVFRWYVSVTSPIHFTTLHDTPRHCSIWGVCLCTHIRCSPLCFATPHIVT